MVSSKKVTQFDFLIVIPHLLHRATGGDREVTFLCKRLVSDGYKVAIIYLRNPEKRLREFVEDANLDHFLDRRPLIHTVYYTLLATKLGFYIVVPLIRKILGIDFRENYYGANVYFLTRIGDYINAKYAIAQSWEAAFFLNAHGGTEKKFFRLHHSVDDPTFSGQLASVAKRSFKLPMRKITENERVYERFRNEDPILIHIGIEQEDFKCHVQPEDRKEVLLIPLRTNESKGAKDAIKVAGLLHDKRPTLKILAFGNLPKSKVPHFIDFRGTVKKKELVKLYNSAAITLIPSIVEGTSIPAIEAMLCGSTLVSTNNEGVRSLVSDRIDGVLVPVGDVEAMANVIIDLLDRPQFRTELALKGMNTASKRSYDKTYQEILHGIIGEPYHFIASDSNS